MTSGGGLQGAGLQSRRTCSGAGEPGVEVGSEAWLPEGHVHGQEKLGYQSERWRIAPQSTELLR